ncbi:MAG TPA: hypothetical protein VNJ12_12555 [Candidatus Dormibacteraeota bacterium]|nr:hypothetical protein [Candidatus Dormibacteraeota bacterium]
MQAEEAKVSGILGRLERLERDNRRLKRTALVALILIVGMAGLGAAYATPAIPQKIVAHEFDVVDASGKVRVRLSVNRYGVASVDALDADGKALVQATASGIGHFGNGAVSISDEQGNSAVINVGLTGSPLLDLRGKLPSITLSGQYGHSRLAPTDLDLYDSDGRPAVSLVNGQGSGGLTFFGKKDRQFGGQSFQVQQVSLTDWGLDFRTEDGTDVIQLGGIPAGGGLYPLPRLSIGGESPSITLSDSQGFEMDLGSTSEVEATSGATKQTSAASIVMFGNDKKHHVIWQAPN